MNLSFHCPSFSLGGFGDQWFSRTLVLLAFLRLANFYLSKLYSTFSLPFFPTSPSFSHSFLWIQDSLPFQSHAEIIQSDHKPILCTIHQHRAVLFWDPLWGTHICLDYPIRTLTCSKYSWAKVLIFFNSDII